MAPIGTNTGTHRWLPSLHNVHPDWQWVFFAQERCKARSGIGLWVKNWTILAMVSSQVSTVQKMKLGVLALNMSVCPATSHGLEPAGSETWSSVQPWRLPNF